MLAGYKRVIILLLRNIVMFDLLFKQREQNHRFRNL